MVRYIATSCSLLSGGALLRGTLLFVLVAIHPQVQERRLIYPGASGRATPPAPFHVRRAATILPPPGATLLHWTDCNTDACYSVLPHLPCATRDCCSRWSPPPGGSAPADGTAGRPFCPCHRANTSRGG